MTRDIEDRLRLFMGGVEVRRIALNMEQIEQFHPPENPAKVTDSRFESCRSDYGERSRELDAPDPNTLVDLITETVLSLRDEEKWEEKVEDEERQRQALIQVSLRWGEVEEMVGHGAGGEAVDG